MEHPFIQVCMENFLLEVSPWHLVHLYLNLISINTPQSLFQLVYLNLNELNNVSCCCEIEIIHLVSANFTPMRKKSLGP